MALPIQPAIYIAEHITCNPLQGSKINLHLPFLTFPGFISFSLQAVPAAFSIYSKLAEG